MITYSTPECPGIQYHICEVHPYIVTSTTLHLLLRTLAGINARVELPKKTSRTNV